MNKARKAKESGSPRSICCRMSRVLSRGQANKLASMKSRRGSTSFYGCCRFVIKNRAGWMLRPNIGRSLPRLITLRLWRQLTPSNRQQIKGTSFLNQRNLFMHNYDFSTGLTRRRFGQGLVVAAAASALSSELFAAGESRSPRKFCAFIKFLRELDYDQLADGIAAAGFDGVEVTAREVEGYVHPAAAPEELPKLQEALAKRGLQITILTTDILSADQPHAEGMLRSAAALKIPFYRMGFYRYDLQQPIVAQLAELKPKFQDIAALNRDVGISAVYQNHCGANFFSATLWDLYEMLKDIPPSEIGCVFDIRHASVEAGEAWPQLFNLMQPYTTALSIKDYVWNGNKSQHTPLGQGRLDRKFFELLAASDFSGPISVHVEYLPQANAEENLQALKTDLRTLKEMLSA